MVTTLAVIAIVCSLASLAVALHFGLKYLEIKNRRDSERAHAEYNAEHADELTDKEQDLIDEAKLNENLPPMPPVCDNRCELCAYFLPDTPNYFDVKQDHCCNPILMQANEAAHRTTGKYFYKDGRQHGQSLEGWQMDQAKGWIMALDDSHKEMTAILGCSGYAEENSLSAQDWAIVLAIREKQSKPKRESTEADDTEE